MDRKQLNILLIILAVLGAVAVGLEFMQSGHVTTVKSTSAGEEVFKNFPVNDVRAVTVKTADSEVNLVQKDKVWEVAERDGFKADSKRIESMLLGLWQLKILEGIQAGPSQYGRLDLLPPAEENAGKSATLVTFKDEDGKILRELFLGKVYERQENRPDPFTGDMAKTSAGRYLKTGDSDAVWLVSETFDDLKTDPSEWLDDAFFKVEKVKTISIDTGNKADNWKLTRKAEDKNFDLVGAKPDERLDYNKIASMKNAFSSPRFEDVVTGEEAKEKPDKTTFVVETFDGFTYTVSVGEKNDLNEYRLAFDVTADFQEERKPGKDESEEDKKKEDKAFQKNLEALKAKLEKEKALADRVYVVRSYVVDSLKKTRAEILTEEEEAPEGPAAGMPLPGSIPGIGNLPGVTDNVVPPKKAEEKKPKAAADSPKPAADTPKEPAKSPKAPEPKADMPKEPAPPAGEEKPAAKAPEKPAAKPEPAPADSKPKPTAKPAPKKSKEPALPAEPAKPAKKPSGNKPAKEEATGDKPAEAKPGEE